MSVINLAARLLRGKLAHDRVGSAADSPESIRRPDVNIVHLHRPLGPSKERLLRGVLEANPNLHARASIQIDKPLTMPSGREGLGMKWSIGDLRRDNDREVCMADSLREQVREKLLLPYLAEGMQPHDGVSSSSAVALGKDGDGRKEEALEFLTEDISSAIQVYRDAIQGDQKVLNVKLEAVQSTTCPRWHADTVTLRLLVTYVGPGTMYVENRHVKRSWQFDLEDDGGGDQQGGGGGALLAIVAAVNEAHARDAGAGDLLFLKGHKWGQKGEGGEGGLVGSDAKGSKGKGSQPLPSPLGDSPAVQGEFYGLGAVHKSPEVDLPSYGEEEEGESFGNKEAEGTSHGGMRLLLTVDDVIAGPPCGCGVDHGP